VIFSLGVAAGAAQLTLSGRGNDSLEELLRRVRRRVARVLPATSPTFARRRRSPVRA
jgi:hypothetical protein